MIIKTFEKDFSHKFEYKDPRRNALTLSPEEVSELGDDVPIGIKLTRIHDSGWKISGYVQEDWFRWVNSFEAVHPTYGKVHGNFEKEVYADSIEGFNHFYENHTPNAWDYWEI